MPTTSPAPKKKNAPRKTQGGVPVYATKQAAQNAKAGAVPKKKPLRTLYAPINKKRKQPEPKPQSPRIMRGVGQDFWDKEAEIRAAYAKAIEPAYRKGRPKKVKPPENLAEAEALIAAELEKPDPEVF